MEQGFESDVPMDTLTVRGLFEVIPRYREIKGIQNRCATACWPSGRRLHRRRLSRLQPRAGRAAARGRHPDRAFRRPADLGLARRPHQEDQRAVSHMLVIFPFEEEIYRRPACRSPISAIRWPS
jgi:lipid-A-disaccharide synthase